MILSQPVEQLVSKQNLHLTKLFNPRRVCPLLTLCKSKSSVLSIVVKNSRSQSIHYLLPSSFSCFVSSCESVEMNRQRTSTDPIDMKRFMDHIVNFLHPLRLLLFSFCSSCFFLSIQCFLFRKERECLPLSLVGEFIRFFCVFEEKERSCFIIRLFCLVVSGASDACDSLWSVSVSFLRVLMRRRGKLFF